ncbi:hypothetical protein E2562_000308 [Oryza meyeriana var. granulata]|uniref:Uncharacterized protein n=1 Tax=Oryza meyeriana var. granulata TaxID=110450 RepID=A0A6G1CMY4_9ORYZ|nr:hypothetical protein E2562_000308 [Oryza meyeriana var. granulata]
MDHLSAAQLSRVRQMFDTMPNIDVTKDRWPRPRVRGAEPEPPVHHASIHSRPEPRVRTPGGHPTVSVQLLLHRRRVRPRPKPFGSHFTKVRTTGRVRGVDVNTKDAAGHLIHSRRWFCLNPLCHKPQRHPIRRDVAAAPCTERGGEGRLCVCEDSDTAAVNPLDESRDARTTLPVALPRLDAARLRRFPYAAR